MPESKRFAVTAEIVTAITSSQILDEVLESVAQWTAETLHLWECDIYEYRRDTGQTVALALWAHTPHPGDTDWIGSTMDLAEQPAFSRVLREGRIIANHIDDPGLPPGDRERMTWWGEQSCLLVPLIWQNTVIGCLELVEKRHIHRFTDEECDLASTLAALSAAAMQNAREHRVEDERNRRLASLLAASRAVSSTLVVEDVLARVAKTATEALQADVCYIYEYLRDEDAIAWQAVFERVHGPQAQELGTIFPLTEFPEDRAVLQRGIIVVENASDDDLLASTRASMDEWGQKTLLSVPLLIEKHPVGLLEIAQLDHERHFTAEEIEFVRALGEQAAVAINNARQYRATEHRNERLVRLVDLSQSLTASLDAGQISERLESGLSTLFSGRRCATKARFSAADQERASLAGLARAAVRRRRPLEQPKKAPGHVIAPLFSGQRLLGLLDIESEPAHPFAKDELEIIQLVANQTAAAVENARLYASVEQMAITDGLTGLYNHRYFYDRLAQEVRRAMRYGLPLSLLMIDIDDFKRFNDRLGHPAGDVLLHALAGVLIDETRQKIDLVARYGGEEFSIILPSTGALGAATAGRRLRDRIAEVHMPDGSPGHEAAGEADEETDGAAGAARVVGERIRRAVEQQRFANGRRPLPITVSVGVASLPDHATSDDGLVAAADAALYEAKSLGKNRVCVAHEQTAPAEPLS
jgi:diguanylate cyclase (GGDEF)-like protein